MSELELKLRQILETMIVETPPGEVERRATLERFRRQGQLLVERTRARSGDAAAQRLQELVKHLLAEYEIEEHPGGKGLQEATRPETFAVPDARHEEDNIDPLAMDNGIEEPRDLPGGMKVDNHTRTSAKSAAEGETRRFRPLVHARSDWRSFAAGFVLAALAALICAGLAWAVFAPARPGLLIPQSDIKAAIPVLEEVRQAMSQVAAQIDAGLPESNPAKKNPGRFVGVARAFPKIYRELSPVARRSGNLIMRVDEGGYKILSQGRLCPLVAVKYPDMIDRMREGDVLRLCLNFGYWNGKGKSF